MLLATLAELLTRRPAAPAFRLFGARFIAALFSNVS
jgi:hypothetical protein